MGKITKYLNQLIVGNVFDDPEVLETYSTDRSIMKIKPKFVAVPESTEDIQKLVKFFDQIATKNIPVSVTVRGSGLDEGGADLSNSLIISTEKLNRLLEIDTRERLVRVQAGMTLKELNTALSVSGLTIPIGGHDQETIGGLISNNPVDLYSAKYNGISRYVERIEVVLSNGDILQTQRYRKYPLAKKAAEKSYEGEIYRKMAKLLKDKEKLIEEFDTSKNGLAGYPTITEVQKRETVDLMPLFFGAQGTLGVISEVILKAVPLRNKTLRFAATFHELDDAIKGMDLIKELKPRQIDLYDLKVIQKARATGKNLDGVIKRVDDGFTVYASFDERPGFVEKRLARIKEMISRNTKVIFDTPENQLALNELENALPSYLNQVKNGERIPVLTDFYLPAVNLEGFMKDLKVLSDKTKLDFELYGSYSTNIYNLRPVFKFDDENLNKKIATLLRAGAYIINRQDGVLTGGTPEGRFKAVVTNGEILDSVKELYGDIKKLFDPHKVLNPDVKLGADSRFTLTHFRDKELPRIVL